MAEQGAQGAVGEATELFAVAFFVLGNEGVGQRRDVARPVAQGRDGDRVGGQPVIQVGAKSAFGDGAGQVDVGGGHQAHIHLADLMVAQAFHLAGLQYPQQLDLRRQRQVAHFIQEQGAAVGALEAAGA